MKWGFITLSPAFIEAFFTVGIMKQAVERGVVDYACFPLRAYALDKHRRVDDRPYGGGPGMLLKPEPLIRAIRAARSWAGESAKVVYVSPQGRTFHQGQAEQWAAQATPIVCIAGRYEGVDQRVIEHHVDEVWSVGDYVVSGGELPSLLLADATLRCVPGVLGQSGSLEEESFQAGLLEYPQYTRPPVFERHEVPSVLQHGHHGAVQAWRFQARLQQTAKYRQDLYEAYRQAHPGCVYEEREL